MLRGLGFAVVSWFVASTALADRAAATTTAAPAPAASRIAVLDIRPKLNVKPDLASALTDSLVTEVRHRSGVKVIGSEELRQMLTFHKTKQQLGCDDTACLAEIGGALGADQLVTANLARFGEAYVLTLRLIDVRHAQVIRDASEQSGTAAEESALALVAKGVEELFPNAPAPGLVPSTNAAAAEVGTSVAAPPKKAHTAAIILLSVGGAMLVTTAVGAYLYGDFYAIKAQSVHTPTSAYTGTNAETNAQYGEFLVWAAAPATGLFGLLGWHAW